MEKGTPIHDERIAKFDSIIDSNPGSSEDNLTNILNAFVWSSQVPTKDQSEKISEKVKAIDLSIQSEEFKELLKKFKSLK